MATEILPSGKVEDTLHRGTEVCLHTFYVLCRNTETHSGTKHLMIKGSS